MNLDSGELSILAASMHAAQQQKELLAIVKIHKGLLESAVVLTF